jgi:hypothetical protein
MRGITPVVVTETMNAYEKGTVIMVALTVEALGSRPRKTNVYKKAFLRGRTQYSVSLFQTASLSISNNIITLFDSNPLAMTGTLKARSAV